MREHDNDSPVNLPEYLGRYRVLGRLGRGGMGEVLLARDERLDREVAIKHRRPEGPWVDRQRLEREARALARLRHPAIVELYEVIDSDHGPCLVLEKIEGRTLAEKITAGPLPIELVIQWGLDIAGALRASHSAGILHRDLKAENVMIDPEGRVKVIDWGLAKPISRSSPEPEEDNLTGAGLVVGTRRVMSPEQIQGCPLDERSDLFSLGVLLFEMTTGRSPFRGADQNQTLVNLLTARSPFLQELRSDAPDELVQLVDRLLAKQADDRPAGAGEVAQTLEQMATRLSLPDRGTQPEPLSDDERWEALAEVPTGMMSETGAERWGDPESITWVSSRPRSPILDPPGRTVPWRSFRIPAIWAVLVIVGIVAFRPTDEPEPRWVAVIEPEVGEHLGEEGALLTGATADAVVRALVEMPGIRVIEPSELGAVDDGDGRNPSAVSAARALAADELLRTRLTLEGGMVWVDLRRIRVADSGLLGVRRLSISSVPRDAPVGAEMIRAEVYRAFGREPPGPSAPSAEDPDYLAFLRLQSEVRAQKVAYTDALDRLGRILRRSPNFSSAFWLAADLAETLYSDTKQSRDLCLARSYLAQAGRLAPNDPTTRIHEVRLAILEGRPELADELLADLETSFPGDPEVAFCRALALEARGAYGDAIDLLNGLVARRPSWRYLFQLATLEFRSGKVDEARRHLDQILTRAPRNLWVLGALLQLELMHGDLERVEVLASRLLKQRHHRSYWTNLGLSRFLLGRYQGAYQAYMQALELDPNHPTTLLNLADTLHALGQAEAAAGTYRQVLAMLDQRADEGALSAAEKLARAQCAARLGDFEKAVGVTLDVLTHTAEDGEMAYQAALVFALVGDRTSALIKARRALDSGMDPRWFRIPVLRGLRESLSLEPA